MKTTKTCGRCGITDARVLDLDTGSACHPELRDCIHALQAALAEVRAICEEELREHGYVRDPHFCGGDHDEQQWNGQCLMAERVLAALPTPEAPRA